MNLVQEPKRSQESELTSPEVEANVDETLLEEDSRALGIGREEVLKLQNHERCVGRIAKKGFSFPIRSD